MKKGFTLIELLVVVLIIGILSAIALPQYTTAVEKARSTEAVSNIGTLIHAGERYYMQTNTWPGTDLDVLDIEVPTTKYYTISAANGTGTAGGWIVSALRNSGSNVHTISAVVLPNGTVKRYCGDAAATTDANGAKAPSTTTAGKICGAITSGHAADGNW